MIVSQGLGDQRQVASIVGAGGNILAAGVPAILAAGASASAAAAGGTASILGMSLGVAVPVIGVAIAGATLAISMFLNRNAEYFAQAKATTGIVDEAEGYLKRNLEAWQQSGKTSDEQAVALNNFDQIWGQVVKACEIPAYGNPGHACVNDRTRGGRWDWFSYYRDPIANDPNVHSAVSQVEDTISQMFSGSGGTDLLPLLIVGGVALVALSL